MVLVHEGLVSCRKEVKSNWSRAVLRPCKQGRSLRNELAVGYLTHQLFKLEVRWWLLCQLGFLWSGTLQLLRAMQLEWRMSEVCGMGCDKKEGDECD